MWIAGRFAFFFSRPAFHFDQCVSLQYSLLRSNIHHSERNAGV